MARTADEIVRDLLDGRLDIADVHVVERVTIEKFSHLGDTPKKTETVVFHNGVQVSVIKEA